MFIDEDNFHPIFGLKYLYDLRSETLGRDLDFEGLSGSDVRRALSAVYKAARATPAYENVMRADRELERSPDKLILWARLAQKGHQDLEATLRGMVIEDGRERGLEIVRTTYAGTPVEGIAAAFRRYNRLVQQVVWSILGLAEVMPGPFVLTEAVGTLRCTYASDGSPSIRVSSREATSLFLGVTHPVWLDTGTPLDGLHMLVAYTINLSPGAASDLSLTPIRWSAGCWPDQAQPT